MRIEKKRRFNVDEEKRLMLFYKEERRKFSFEKRKRLRLLNMFFLT
jgi:hypothetical protein